MTTLGMVAAGRANGKTSAMPFDIGRILLDVGAAVGRHNMTASIAGPGTLPAAPIDLGGPAAVLASVTAWTQQDDDAHEPCSLTACRHPLHPGPCKGWKGTLHSVSPGTYHQIEAERVKKANARRVQRIADLRSQGKPIPRRLLTEIKAKPAPPPPPPHPPAVPLGQVNQKADLAGGQAHHAGQAVTKAAGITVKTAPLPLGPKQKKPTVAGRGPAFVITQPKVTDTYKLDKAAKITPQEWNGLTDADKTTIRNELTAIKARGFGPQQKKSDELLAKLPAPGAANGLAPGTPGTVTTPSGKVYQKVSQTPGKVSLGQASKPVPAPTTAQARATLGLPPAAPTPPAAPKARRPDTVDQVRQAIDPSAKLAPAARTFIYRNLDKKQFDSLTPAEQKQVTADLNHQIANGTGSQTRQLAQDLKDRFHPAAPAAPSGPTPSAPLSPGTAAHVQHANAVANRSAPKAQMAKTHLDSYGKLSKAEFDSLAPAEQKTIRDDLANAKGKFLDPKKQQAATDLLDRFGSRHPVSAAPGGKAPGSSAVPVPSAKGYSDPMNEAVKAASSVAPSDDVIKRIGQLSHTSVGRLDAADRRTITARLDFIANHSQSTPHTAARAAALKKMIDAGPQPDGTKRDHEPSLNALHAEAQTRGAKEAAKVADALKAADKPSGLTPGTMHVDRVKDLSALSKTQFDALRPEEQRKITDALHGLHTAQKGSSGITALDKDAEKALTAYTGVHPGIHQLRQAEADFRAEKITADDVWSEYLHARVASPSKMSDPNSPGARLEKEAQRIAEDNPTMPVWLRAELIDNPYSGYSGTYHSIARAQNKYNFVPAPRLSSSDISDIFRATETELASAHPIHAEAVKALRTHIIETGLAPGSPWSTATKNHVVDNLLHISGSDPEIPPERLKEFEGLPLAAQVKVARILRQRITDQTNDHAKTGTWLALRRLDGSVPLTPNQHEAVKAAASGSYASPTMLDTYRKLDPQDFGSLPLYARDAIDAHLDGLQTRAERGGPVSTWSTTDNPFKVMPATLKDHLNGMRTVYSDRRMRHASDISNFGTKVINPYDRTRVYSEVPISQFRLMTQGDQDLINADLDKIAHDTGHPLPIRYNALFTKDFQLSTPTNLSGDQIVAIGITDPRPGRDSFDPAVVTALGKLSKADFDKLDKTYRDAIDERVARLPGAFQTAINATLHPQAPAASPSGYTPTTVQANVQPHVQAALDTIYGVHASGKSHTMAHQLATYGALRGSDFGQLNAQEQGHLLGDLSFIATTAKGPSADKAKKLIDRFTPAGTPAGQIPTGAVIPPANAVPGQVRYPTPLKGLEQAKDSGTSGDKWISLPGGGRVWGEHGAAGLLLQHVDPQTGEKRYLMVQRGPAISDPGKWTFPGGASDSKETPHQGAARETIEELGLKADALKDALVHGDHTFSVPNHSWKYTTVAAQVSTMIKPNLTTAHARAETSDAKWMTIDEIRALDKSGQLHAPIAGGKLEQNVISLYPQGTGQTLGQVTRPGPVTKRLGRLNLPSGGRQAPASFNAWPHPHKQSKGRNLVSDKTNIDKLRQDVKQARKQYDAKTADGRLAAIGSMQGFDDTPTVASKKEVDRLLATGDYIEVWRGVKGGNYRAGGKTAAQINEEMRSGPAYYGKGIFGNGYYLATQKSVATQYADGTKNSISRILIPKSAVTEHYDKVEGEAHAASSRSSKAKGNTYEEGTLYDPGRWAAAKGVDGIEIQSHHTSSGGWARHVAKPGQPAFNWLNRSVLIIQEAQ